MATYADSPAVLALAYIQDPLFMYAISFLTVRGFDLPLEGIAAREYVEELALNGCPNAQFVCGMLYSCGIFGTLDSDKARQFYELSAESGNPMAMLSLASCIESAEDDQVAGIERSMIWRDKSAAMNFGPAKAALAILYLHGIGVERDYVYAMKLFRESAILGDATGQYSLGAEMCKDIKWRNIDEGLHWLKMSSLQGYIYADHYLADIYEDGMYGVEVDAVLSKRHRTLAQETEARILRRFSV